MKKKLAEIIHGRPLYTVTKDATVREVAELLATHRIGAVPVVDNQRIVGIFSERDVIARVIVNGLDPAHTRMAEVMTRNPVVARSDESYQDCADHMRRLNIRHVPVVEDDRLVGMVSLRDILWIDNKNKEEEISYLHDYIHAPPPEWSLAE
ncbi:MAG: CBS domain-containing protein [Planctomycetota bacterium]